VEGKDSLGSASVFFLEIENNPPKRDFFAESPGTENPEG